MSLKKFLKMTLKKKAQASLEYFIIFSVIAGLTLLSLSSFLPKVKTTGEEFFKKAAERIIK